MESIVRPFLSGPPVQYSACIVHVDMHVKVRGQFLGLVLSFCQVGLGAWTHAVQCLCLLSPQLRLSLSSTEKYVTWSTVSPWHKCALLSLSHVPSIFAIFLCSEVYSDPLWPHLLHSGWEAHRQPDVGTAPKSAWTTVLYTFWCWPSHGIELVSCI